MNREEETHKNYVCGKLGSDSFIPWSIPTGSDPCHHKTIHVVRGSFSVIFKLSTIWKWRVHWLEVTEKERCNIFNRKYGLDDLIGPYFLWRWIKKKPPTSKLHGFAMKDMCLITQTNLELSAR